MNACCAAGCVLLSAAALDACSLPPGVAELQQTHVPGVAAGFDAFLLDACSDVALQVRELLDAAPLDDADDGFDDRDYVAPAGDEPAAGEEEEEAAPTEPSCGDRPSDAADRPSDSGDDEEAARRRSAALSRRARSSLWLGSRPSRSSTPHRTSMDESALLAMDAAAADARDAQLVREQSLRHFCAQLLRASGTTLAHVALSARGRPAVATAACALSTLYATLLQAYARRARLPLGMSWERGCIGVLTLSSVLMALNVIHYMLQHAPDSCPGMLRSQCVRAYFRLLHAPVLPFVWVAAQLPPQHVFAGEVARSGAYVAAALAVAARAGELTWRYAAAVRLEGACCTLAVPIVVSLLSAAPETVSELLLNVETCPAPLRRGRDAALRWGAAARRRCLPRDGKVADLLDMQSKLTVRLALLLASAGVASGRATVPHASSVLMLVIAVVISSSAYVKLRPSSAAALSLLAAQLAKEARERSLDILRARLDASTSAGAAAGGNEAANLRDGCEALLALLPSTCAVAIGTFAEGAGSDVLAALECAARGDDMVLPLEESLPASVGACASGGASGRAFLDSSVWRVCGSAGREAGCPLDSAACADGLAACADWRAAVQAGLPTSRAITLPVNAGPVLVGFITLHFDLFRSAAPPSSSMPSSPSSSAMLSPADTQSLKAVSEAVAAAVFVRRAFATNRDAFAAGLRAAGVPEDVSSSQAQRQHRGSSPTRRLDALTARAQAAAVAAAARFSPEEDAAALEALDASADADAALLAEWGLDAWTLPDAELQRLFSSMMHALGLFRAFAMSPRAFDALFMPQVAARMSAACNAFHNFRHVFMVTHQVYLFLTQSALRRTRLRDVDVLALMLSAICHDLEHGGFTNAYLVNSGAPLARLYNDASCNENHHCAVAFELLEEAGLLAGLGSRDARAFRKLVVGAILSTDMACHKDLLARVASRLADEAAAAAAAEQAQQAAAHHGGGGSSLEDEVQQVAFVSFVLHCADLCCPLLPPPLSRRISGDLSREFEAQAAAERAAHLPVSVMEAPTELAKAKMEIGFLGARLRRASFVGRQRARACLACVRACAQRV
jgi:hypothetical protein